MIVPPERNPNDGKVDDTFASSKYDNTFRSNVKSMPAEIEISRMTDSWSESFEGGRMHRMLVFERKVVIALD